MGEELRKHLPKEEDPEKEPPVEPEEEDPYDNWPVLDDETQTEVENDPDVIRANDKAEELFDKVLDLKRELQRAEPGSREAKKAKAEIAKTEAAYNASVKDLKGAIEKVAAKFNENRKRDADDERRKLEIKLRNTGNADTRAAIEAEILALDRQIERAQLQLAGIALRSLGEPGTAGDRHGWVAGAPEDSDPSARKIVEDLRDLQTLALEAKLRARDPRKRADAEREYKRLTASIERATKALKKARREVRERNQREQPQESKADRKKREKIAILQRKVQEAERKAEEGTSPAQRSNAKRELERLLREIGRTEQSLERSRAEAEAKRVKAIERQTRELLKELKKEETRLKYKYGTIWNKKSPASLRVLSQLADVDKGIKRARKLLADLGEEPGNTPSKGSQGSLPGAGSGDVAGVEGAAAPSGPTVDAATKAIEERVRARNPRNDAEHRQFTLEEWKRLAATAKTKLVADIATHFVGELQKRADGRSVTDATEFVPVQPPVPVPPIREPELEATGDQDTRGDGKGEPGRLVPCFKEGPFSYDGQDVGEGGGFLIVAGPNGKPTNVMWTTGGSVYSVQSESLAQFSAKYNIAKEMPPGQRKVDMTGIMLECTRSSSNPLSAAGRGLRWLFNATGTTDLALLFRDIATKQLEDSSVAEVAQILVSGGEPSSEQYLDALGELAINAFVGVLTAGVGVGVVKGISIVAKRRARAKARDLIEKNLGRSGLSGAKLRRTAEQLLERAEEASYAAIKRANELRERGTVSGKIDYGKLARTESKKIRADARLARPPKKPIQDGNLPGPGRAVRPELPRVPRRNRSRPEDWPADEAASRIDDLKSQGHGPQRHEGQVGQAQHDARVLRGVDPETGAVGPFRPRHSSSFRSNGAYSQADMKARASPEFDQQIGSREIVVEDLSLSDALGPGYRQHVEGRTRVGSSTTTARTTDFENGKIKAIYRANYDGGGNIVGYKLHTMYAQGR